MLYNSTLSTTSVLQLNDISLRKYVFTQISYAYVQFRCFFGKIGKIMILMKKLQFRKLNEIYLLSRVTCAVYWAVYVTSRARRCE